MGKRIIEELATDTIQDNDFILMDNNTTPTDPDDDTAGTRKMRAKEFGAQIITVDDELSTSSENPVQNKVITGAINDLASATEITGTASGSIASFDDGSTLPLKTLQVSIEPVQSGSGDPSPINICPISGWDGANVEVDGKNLFDKNAVDVGKWLTTDTGEEENATNYVVTEYIPVEANKPVFIPATKTVRRWFYNSNKVPTRYLNASGDQTFIPLEDGYIRVTILVNGTGAVDLDTFQIEYGSSASEYSPFNGNTYPISWQTECGTVYGGNFKVFKDGGEWYCTVTKVSEGYVFTKDDEWEYTSANRFKCNKACGFNVSGDGYNYVTSTTSNFKYEYVYTSSILSDNCMTWFASTDNLFIRADGYADLTSFKAFLQSNPITIVGELATPETYTFEIDTEIATLLGVNNIFADCGDVDVTYQRDLNIVINKLLQG